jgi:IclR family transcriptional regulator, pca regulon regulatory protein
MTSDTKNVISVYAITRCNRLPAIATTGTAQKGCSIFDTFSAIATAIAVCGTDACNARHQNETIIYICHAETSRIISVPLFIGSTLPSYCTSMGRGLLAALPLDSLERFLTKADFPQRTQKTITNPERMRAELQCVRENGWAIVDGELEPGLRSIAVPARNTSGSVVAAINLGTQVTRRDADWLLNTALPEL